MRTVTVTWQPDRERFVAAGTHPGQVIAVNAPHGPAGDHPPTGLSATELLLAGAGACAAGDIVEIVRKGRQRLTGVEVRVLGEQDPEPPRAYRRISVHFTIRGTGLRPSVVERAVRLSCDRYCSVIATIRGSGEVITTFELAGPALAAPSA